MTSLITIEEALKLKKAIFIDVRSPAEYAESTIVDAVNFPILNDEERAEIGTVYRRDSHQKAIRLGVKYASYKLPSLYDQIVDYQKEYEHIIFFCWRGGMRSKSVCNFLSMFNVPQVYQLAGGYKAYRKFIMDYFENHLDPYHFIMVHGLTGVGKTHILEGLSEKGLKVLNLEKLAQNSGSVFGDIVFKGSPPSQKMFESMIFHILYGAAEKNIFVESESKRIGNVQIPDKIYQRMVAGSHVLVNTSLENRVNIILKDYINHVEEKEEKIRKAIEHLRKRLGNEAVDHLLQKQSEKAYPYIIRYLIEYYYDPLYQYSIEKYKNYDLEIFYDNIENAIKELRDFEMSLKPQK
ncbi:tRNA 2-selenouridine synthase [Geosporobacter subterraneus DSM 17957]|uniref:tRNA 2-selenouridine synthase n=1 Tax=Geosporobacter subterraneus DSM 17957 TaxID=1121919 RepID=A0A1M6DZ88_9FIRM|nr:tRNA 2-selenouridine(34) synthase MnmH [Geosporobacter subterraneus]SHI78567.1 tRNA 2-selenouridine synthase [Geosporobacter subterraneus DSM 17957]